MEMTGVGTERERFSKREDEVVSQKLVVSSSLEWVKVRS